MIPCGSDLATSMASFWMENPTDKDRLLLKLLRQIRTLKIFTSLLGVDLLVGHEIVG